MAWDGTERRKHNEMDLEIRDKIIESHSDIKNLVKSVDKHIVEDEVTFKEIKGQIQWLQRVTYAGLGALALLKFLWKG